MNEIMAQSCALLTKWAHAAASLRVVPPPRNGRENTKKARVSLGVDMDDDEVLVIAQELHTVQVSLMDRFRARYGSRVRLVTISFETRGWVET